MFGSKLLATVGKVKNLVGDLDDKLNPEDSKGKEKGLFGRESKKEEEERLQREADALAIAEADKKKKTNMMLMIAGAVVLFMLFGKKLMK